MKVNIKWSICRICLEEVENEGKSIFDYDEDKQEICAKIRECGGINIYRKSNLPSIICNTCLLHLNIAYRFRSVCQSSDEKLQTFLDKTEVLNKKITPDCSFLEVDDLILNQSNEIFENDDEQYFVYYADPEEIDDNPLAQDPTKNSSDSLPHFKQEYTLDEEYIIETEDDPKNANLLTTTKDEETYELNVSLESDSKDIDNIYDEKNVNILTLESKTEEILEKNDSIVEESTEEVKIRRKKRGASGVDQQKYVCDVCGNQYDRKYTLQQHMKWHSDDKPFACELCGKAFVTEYQIHRHMRVHTGEKPYKCQYCERKFSDASSRMKHERIHTNVRPFKCDVCDKSFNYSDVLRVHKMTHSGEKPYACELCGKRFSQMHHLKAHLQTLSHKALAESGAY
ncbi:transcription factor Ouib-like [Condylostylus longicornis]|uniref:transcription factor Ouib-like n=1 Tax=Condylostylus longicornis TaxID=2530218 RepID=UPI00244DC84C|nr:transcription factor Ouib-like [Condylostylus longicornis]